MSEDITHRRKAEFLAEYLDSIETAGPYGITADVVDLADTLEKALQVYESTKG